MDDCGSRSKQLEQMLNEYQAHLKLDDPNSEFTEGSMEFLRKNLSSNSLLQNYIKLIISLPIIITVVQSEFVVCLPFVNNLHKFVLTFISSP